MSNNIINSISKIKTLYNEIENFQQKAIDDASREKAFQFNKLSQKVDELKNSINIYKNWVNLYEFLNLNKNNDEMPLNELKQYLNKINLSNSIVKDLTKFHSDLDSYSKRIEDSRILIKSSIKDQIVEIQSNIIKTWNLIVEFSNIPEINEEISKRYMDFFKNQLDKKEFLDCIKNLEDVDKLLNIEKERITKFIKLNDFSNSLDKYLNFDEISKKYHFTSTQINDLAKIIKIKDELKLNELELESLQKIKQELPEFYSRLFLRFK